MTKNEYNGWTNYETWVVNLWLDNDEGSQRYWAEEASQALENATASEHSSKEEEAIFALSNQLKEQHEEGLPELQGFASDLLNAAMSEVNWHEIAKGLVDAAKEETA